MIKIASAGIAIRIASLFVGLISSILLARFLGPTRFGEYAFLVTVIDLFSVALLFGTRTLLTREVAAGLIKKTFADVKGVIHWGKLIVVYGCFPVMAIAILIIKNWSIKQEDHLSLLTMILAVILIPIVTLLRQASSVLQGAGKIVASQLFGSFVGPAFFLLLLMFIWVFSPQLITIETTFLCYLIGQLITLFSLEIINKKSLPAELQEVKPIYHHREWLSSSWRLLLIGSMLIINTRIDLFMLGFMEDASQVGLYRVAKKGSGLMLYGVMAVDSIINPKASQLKAVMKMRDLQALVSRSIWIVALFSLPILGIYWIIGKDLIILAYGVNYADAWIPMIILCCGYLSLIFLGRGGVILTMTNFEKYTARAIGIGALVNIILNFILIPTFGLLGAAMATAFAVSLRMIIEAWFAYKKVGIDTTILAVISNKFQKFIKN